MTAIGAPRSCASCDETGCAMNRRHRVEELPAARTSYILDDVWPEYASMVASVRRPEDQMLSPGIWGSLPARYRWPGAVQHCASLATAHRHLAMRSVAKSSGGARQRTYLARDRALARALNHAIDYRAGHLLVAQAWLPWLDEVGALGGRTFDVLMSRYPFAEIHCRLDAVAQELSRSPTVSDFRADADLVARETELLARARRVITPHHGIATLFPARTLLLAWHRPPPAKRNPGNRVAFLGPTIARERPDILRALASKLEKPLIVFGEMLERSNFWDGIEIERREFGPDWLDGIGAIIHPAPLTSQPRRLLQAIASGARVYATDGCGLDPADYLALDQFTEQAEIAAPQAA